MADAIDPLQPEYTVGPGMRGRCALCLMSKEKHYFFRGKLRCPGTPDERANRAQVVVDLIMNGACTTMIVAKLRLGHARAHCDAILALALRVACRLHEQCGGNPLMLALMQRRLAEIVVYLESGK